MKKLIQSLAIVSIISSTAMANNTKYLYNIAKNEVWIYQQRDYNWLNSTKDGNYIKRYRVKCGGNCRYIQEQEYNRLRVSGGIRTFVINYM